MAALHFTDAQRDEQLLAGQKVAELALMHQASPHPSGNSRGTARIMLALERKPEVPASTPD